MSKGQIGLEMIVAIAFVILIFLSFFLFYLNKNREIKELDNVLELRDECFKISNLIESAITLGEGYSSQLVTDYTVILNNGTILISDGKTDTACSYRGNVVSGNYTGILNISNNNNNISIQNA